MLKLASADVPELFDADALIKYAHCGKVLNSPFLDS